MNSVSVDISVIIPTYNRPDLLERCLTGFKHLKSTEFNFEIVVVDDGSPLNVGDAMAAHFDDLSVRWIRQLNKGPATARNVGAKAAEGKFIAFMDDDCLPDPEWLFYLFRALSSRPTVLVGGKTINGLSQNLYSEASQLLVRYLYDYFEEKNGRFFTSNNFAMSRQLFHQVGGFDETMSLAAGEDREFCYRWMQAGLHMDYQEKAVAYHFHQLSRASFWRQHFAYGRGAHQYHRLKAAQNQTAIRLEPLAFYGSLLTYPLGQKGGRMKRPLSQKMRLVWLMGVSQLANGVGYFYEKWRGSAT